MTTSLDNVVILRRELLAQGYNDTSIRREVQRGLLHRVRHGSYVDAALWRSLEGPDRHRVLVRAVLRTAHPSAVVSHVSAVVEHGADVWGHDLDLVHLTRQDGNLGRREAGVVQHRGVLEVADIVRVGAIKVTRPARAAVETISLGHTEPALVTVNSLLHAGKMTQEDLFETNRALKHWPRTLGAPVVLRLCDDRVESVGETRTLFLCHRYGLPLPVPQVEIRDEHGNLVARLDFAWPDRGVFLEFHGREKYFRYRRPGESLEEFVLREKRRSELVSQLTGWVGIPITWTDLENHARTARRIERMLHRGQGLGA